MEETNTAIEGASWWGNSQEGDSNLVPIIGGSMLIVLAILITVGLKLNLFVRGRRKELERELQYMRHVTNTAAKRLNLIERHTSEYFHSLAAETSKSLFRAKELIRGIELLEKRAAERLGERDACAIDEAENILNSPIEVSGGEEGEGRPLALHRDDWDTHLNELIESIGRDVLRASSQARAVRPSKRESQETYTDLLLAGIRSACKHGKKLTKSFLSPFQEQQTAEQLQEEAAEDDSPSVLAEAGTEEEVAPSASTQGS